MSNKEIKGEVVARKEIFTIHAHWNNLSPAKKLVCLAQFEEWCAAQRKKLAEELASQ